MIPILSENGFNVVELIVHHLQDMPLWHLEIAGIDLSITKRIMMMWIGVFFLFIIFIPLARKISKDPYKKPSRFSGMMEVFIDFIRKDVGEGSMGHYSKHYEPFLLTLFFFILAGNLLGLVPPLGEFFQVTGELTGLIHHQEGAGHDIPFLAKLWPGITSTGDIGVTASLAFISFIVIQLAGFIHQGIAYIKNIVPNGIPGPMWIIMWPIEVFGQFTKPFALAIRLLANMTAGHMIILVFMGFIFQFQSYAVVPISIAASTAIYMLELFVAFLQAYIFVFLTALFVAGAQHRH
ncbi:MAG: F0F1 ATP synthase subunit A [Spirochaetia bacterium]|nr:F0F1 ATP synthase subunit A [Spirochaetia bacterium]